MSELKAHRFITTDELFPEANAGVLYYEKSEADKVIADLEESHKKEVGQLLIEIAELKKEKEYVVENTAEVINGQESENRELKARIAELKEAQRWRKFSEEKPEHNGIFIVLLGEHTRTLDVYDTDKGKFRTYMPTAWMPLPSAPKEEK